MIILFGLLLFCFILSFVYFYGYVSKLERSVEELFDLYYKKEHNFEILEKEGDNKHVGKYIERFKSFLDND